MKCERYCADDEGDDGERERERIPSGFTYVRSKIQSS